MTNSNIAIMKIITKCLLFFRYLLRFLPTKGTLFSFLSSFIIASVNALTIITINDLNNPIILYNYIII